MKQILLILALSGMVAGADADPADLEGGALITHYVEALALSEPPPEGVCAAYEPYAITSAAAQVNRIDTDTYQIVNWFVLAAWHEAKECCGIQFGFSDYDPGVFGFTYFDACFPESGGLSIPSTAWPAPNEGIAFVSTGDPWTGNWLPVYWFIGYAYGYGAPDLMQLVPDPTVPEPFGGMGNCASPPEKWDALLGGMGINMDGTYVEPYTPVPRGACCLGPECVIVTEEECIAQGGQYQGNGIECEPVNPCEPTAACCIYGECIMTTASACAAAAGEWLEGEVCEPNPCPLYRVCCLWATYECILAFEEECEALGGEFHPEWDSCEPNLCEFSSPARKGTRWGEIKGLYR